MKYILQHYKYSKVLYAVAAEVIHTEPLIAKIVYFRSIQSCFCRFVGFKTCSIIIFLFRNRHFLDKNIVAYFDMFWINCKKAREEIHTIAHKWFRQSSISLEKVTASELYVSSICCFVYKFPNWRSFVLKIAIMWWCGNCNGVKWHLGLASSPMRTRIEILNKNLFNALMLSIHFQDKKKTVFQLEIYTEFFRSPF